MPEGSIILYINMQQCQIFHSNTKSNLLYHMIAGKECNETQRREEIKKKSRWKNKDIVNATAVAAAVVIASRIQHLAKLHSSLFQMQLDFSHFLRLQISPLYMLISFPLCLAIGDGVVFISPSSLLSLSLFILQHSFLTKNNPFEGGAEKNYVHIYK